MSSEIHYVYYPRSEEPPEIADELLQAFREHEATIGTRHLDKGLKSKEVLAEVRPSLEEIGFEMQQGRKEDELVYRPVSFGEDGETEQAYKVDGYHSNERCCIEIEAGRALDSGEVYKNLIFGAMMVRVDTLVLAVPNAYKHANGTTRAYRDSKEYLDNLYRSDRIELPYDVVLIGY